MSYYSCRRPDDHLREGREDFERHGRYGYDSFKYDDPFDDCNKAYTDGFNEARREDERREERREEERREEQRYERQRVEAKRQREQDEEDEEDYWARQYQPEPQQQYPEPQQEQRYPDDGLPF